MAGLQGKRRKLDTVGRVASELGRVYRLLDAGQIDENNAKARAAVLTACRQALEIGGIEDRLAELEAHK
jgi:hypothetical protein